METSNKKINFKIYKLGTEVKSVKWQNRDKFTLLSLLKVLYPEDEGYEIEFEYENN